jgi:dimethylamine monooxygenase subunit A
MTFSHTPYDGSSQPFTIGLKPLDPAAWLEVDEHYGPYLAEKQRLYAERPGDIFAAEADTGEAQQEVAELVAAHMAMHLPQIELPAVDPSDPPLKATSLRVQEDLVLMRKGDDGWRLAAASLCFPSSWSLAEKFGRPLADIHDPVPGFGRETRNAELIERMFDKLQGQIVLRWNWSLQNNPALYHPLSNVQRDLRASDSPTHFSELDPAASAFIRVERQTLRKLPRSGDILFTIRIFIDPMKRLNKHPDRKRLAGSFADQLAGLHSEQLEYKGLSAERDRLEAALRAIAEREAGTDAMRPC